MLIDFFQWKGKDKQHTNSQTSVGKQRENPILDLQKNFNGLAIKDEKVKPRLHTDQQIRSHKNPADHAFQDQERSSRNYKSTTIHSVTPKNNVSSAQLKPLASTVSNEKSVDMDVPNTKKLPPTIKSQNRSRDGKPINNFSMQSHSATQIKDMPDFDAMSLAQLKVC